MAHEIPIPGTNKKMIVEKDGAGNLISVKDEKGNPASKKRLEEVTINLKCGDIDAVVMDVANDTTLFTKHNPTCCWYFINGNWYYICTG